MKITIINGTNRIGNKSMEVSKASQGIINDLGHESKLITLDNFDALFRGEYINFENANESQKGDLENMLWADILIFVVPTYHHGIPSPLKNFLDIINDVSVFEGKKVGFIAVGKDSKGVIQTQQVISGIFSYNENKSYTMPKVAIISPSDIDTKRLQDYFKYCVKF